VTVCHSKTDDLPGVTRQADILVAAIGRPAFIRAEHIRPGAAVVDVGINRVDDPRLAASCLGEDSPRLRLMKERGFVLIGDVHPLDGMARAGSWARAGWRRPLTIACLLRNTLRAARARREGAAR
jgi:methylenetetrahydrofolate dehydrogenase (NADP+)/methenyltetrahydrofolate cyclohydrolase